MWLAPGLTAIVGTAVAVLAAWRVRIRTSPGCRKRSGGDALQLECTVCGHDLFVAQDEVFLLPPVERGLAVTADAKLAGKALAEYDCPFCEAAHCFEVRGRTLRWVGTNLYQAQEKSSRCQECGKRLKPAPWPPDAHKGRPLDAPQFQDDFGLVCGFCRSVVCLACARRITRGRLPDGILMCPRCRRHPVDTFFRGVLPPDDGTRGRLRGYE